MGCKRNREEKKNTRKIRNILNIGEMRTNFKFIEIRMKGGKETRNISQIMIRGKIREYWETRKKRKYEEN